MHLNTGALNANQCTVQDCDGEGAYGPAITLCHGQQVLLVAASFLKEPTVERALNEEQFLAKAHIG